MQHPALNAYDITRTLVCDISEIPALYNQAEKIVIEADAAVDSGDVLGGIRILQKGIDELKKSEHYPKQ